MRRISLTLMALWPCGLSLANSALSCSGTSYSPGDTFLEGPGPCAVCDGVASGKWSHSSWGVAWDQLCTSDRNHRQIDRSWPASLVTPVSFGFSEGPSILKMESEERHATLISGFHTHMCACKRPYSYVDHICTSNKKATTKTSRMKAPWSKAF